MPVHHQETKRLRDGLRKRNEGFEDEERRTSAERAHILRELRQQAADALEALERQRRRQHEVELELGTLRGRLAHGCKEQSEWYQDLRAQEQAGVDALMQEMQKGRRTHAEHIANEANGDESLMLPKLLK